MIADPRHQEFLQPHLSPCRHTSPWEKNSAVIQCNQKCHPACRPEQTDGDRSIHLDTRALEAEHLRYRTELRVATYVTPFFEWVSNKLQASRQERMLAYQLFRFRG